METQCSTMAGKTIIQLIISMAQVVGRGFARAVKQEYAASQEAAARRTGAGASNRKTARHAATDTFTGMTVQEAKQILNVQDISDAEKLQKTYDHLFEVNDKSKGGSLYLQSKIVRAKERIDLELKDLKKDSQSGETDTKPPPES
ncbi:hypothetical protein KUTeg_024353 [Tegillarca granosa]|uniref:Uncharacterized protein n=1 Tax=Tegillarca granosa TaxID=220873 RepID=A0ABQ9E2M0_TEGGR|nr:hypothetical protein KUTeg_024353 [Tegillarca granosa]